MHKTDGQFNVPNEYSGEQGIACHVTPAMHSSHKFQKGVNKKASKSVTVFTMTND